VIDAGALEFTDFETLTARSILTPHAGEMSRLLGRFGETWSREQVEQNPADAVKLAARKSGQVVLLKGNVTTIADPSGNAWNTPPANPALATAGSGDVLAGILGALIAGNFTKIESGEIELAQIALAGALLHARAGEGAAAAGPVVAMDIAESLRTVVGDLLA
jgi:NAD(P)H-hydrate repair Nnr-like enzyme with NAD(P)H-hydrate dehydratase domain